MSEPVQRWKLTCHMGMEQETETVEIPEQDLQGTDEENLDYVLENYCGDQFRFNYTYATARRLDEGE